MSCAGAEGRGKTPCKFAEKVWNAQNAGAAGVRPSLDASCVGKTLRTRRIHGLKNDLGRLKHAVWIWVKLPFSGGKSSLLQAIIVNYEDRKTTMEAPNDEDDSMT